MAYTNDTTLSTIYRGKRLALLQGQTILLDQLPLKTYVCNRKQIPSRFFNYWYLKC
jgi:hypothetical protein